MGDCRWQPSPSTLPPSIASTHLCVIEAAFARSPALNLGSFTQFTTGGGEHGWELFADDVWCTVLGVACGKVHVVYDGEPSVAVPLPTEDYNAAPVDTDSKGYVAAPPLEPALPDDWSSQAPLDPTDLEQGSNEAASLGDPVPHVDPKAVDDNLQTADESKVGDLCKLLFLLPADHLPEIVDWMLSLHGLHLGEGESVRDGCRKLVVVRDTLHQAVVVPTLAQWHSRQRVEWSPS